MTENIDRAVFTDQTLTQMFSTPQLSYRKEKALSNHRVSARTLREIPPNTTDIPLQISSENYRVKTCHRALCSTCPILLSYHTISSSVTQQPFHLTDTFTCSSTNLIYVIICSKCSKMYVGQTTKTIRNRFRHHRAAAKEKRAWPIYLLILRTCRVTGADLFMWLKGPTKPF